MRTTRRHFLTTSTALAGLGALSTVALPGAGRAKVALLPPYRRPNANSAEGRAMMASYATAIARMMALPPEHPHNWFRIAFQHLMDCPHMNWWFFVWHRGYLGFVEKTLRHYSGNPRFALPFWDWTEHPRLPEEMFKGVLTPVNAAYAKYTKDLDTFTAYMKGPLKAYWDTLDANQLQRMVLRGYTDTQGKASFDALWATVSGCDADGGNCNVNNQTFAPTDRARYSTAENPWLSEEVRQDCAPDTVLKGLETALFVGPDADHVALGLNSQPTDNHSQMAAGATLESSPHNNIHNFIGGYPQWAQGPYGNMAANLSPTDPIFFLHHANMDRLWDIWTRKQQASGAPYLPAPDQRERFMAEPFLFFVREDGRYVTDGKAGDYMDTARFNYDYAPGFGSSLAEKPLKRPAPGALVAGVDSVTLPGDRMGKDALLTTITFQQPTGTTPPRVFTLVPSGPVGELYEPAQVSIFGPPMRGMAHSFTFAVVLTPKRTAAGKSEAPAGTASLSAAPAALTLTLLPVATGPAPAKTAQSATPALQGAGATIPLTRVTVESP